MYEIETYCDITCK